MAFLNRFRKFAGFGAQAEATHTLKSDALLALIREAMGTANVKGVTINETTAMRTAAYNGCVRIISGAVANLPWHIKRRVSVSERRIEDEHQIAILLSRRPNRFTRQPVAFKRMITAHKLNCGNFYAQIVRSPFGGKITDLHPLNPLACEPKQATDGTITYEYRTTKGMKVFNQDEIFHVMGPTLDGIKGLSVMSYARETLGENILARDQGQAMFRNGLRIPGSVTHPGKLSNTAKGNIADSIKEYMPGGKKEDDFMVLEEAMKFIPHAMNPVDAQWIEARKLSRIEIAMFFGVPPHMLGDTEKTTSFGQGIEEMSIGFVNFTLADHIADIQDAMDSQLLANEVDLYLDIDLKGLLAGDFEKRMRGYALGRQWGWLSENDVRAREDMNPLSEGDNYLTPTTHTITGAPPASSPAPASGA